MSVKVRPLAELFTPERVEAWRVRRTQRNDPLLRAIWGRFIEIGGPLTLGSVAVAFPDLSPESLHARVAALDAADLVQFDGDRVTLAYPFTAEPNAFEVVLPGGRTRHACCAIDALGVAPMIGAPVTLRTQCHRSGEPLVFEVDPVDGPSGAPSGALVWVERGRWGGDRLSGFL